MPVAHRRARPPAARGASAILATFAVAMLCAAACSAGPSGTIRPTATPVGHASSAPLGPTQAATLAPSPTPTHAPPLPSGALLLPTEFQVELEPGRYVSTPPFDVPFTFLVAEAGWQTGHLNGEFFDLQRWDGVPQTGLPSLLLGFANPDTIRGVTTNLPVANFTPAAAVAELTSRIDIETANVEELELFGREAVRVDIHAPIENAPIFGGRDGTFRQGIEPDSRLVFVATEGGLLLVVVGAKPGALEPAWERALGILETVEL